MKKLITIILVLMSGYLVAQNEISFIEGQVSFVSSNNVYVKFPSMEGIHIGDTLYSKAEGNYNAILIIKNLSSLSCVAERIRDVEIENAMLIYARRSVSSDEYAGTEVENDNESKSPTVDEFAKNKPDIKNAESKLKGKFAISSYTFFSSNDSLAKSSQRFKYNLSLNARRINNSPISFETYISFHHKTDEWDAIKENIFNGLKIYNLALNADLKTKTNLWFGRKINRRISNIGAIDGLQIEQKFNDFVTGLVAGYRPDFQDYGFNSDLFQYGVYLGHNVNNEFGRAESNIAFLNQSNNGNTDRRLLYFQHSNTLAKDLFLFGSGEVDIYQKVDSVVSSNAKLSNLYLSLRYRFSREVSLSFSYSARNNVIYYETYKNFIDDLIDKETRQGYALSATVRPNRNITAGLKLGYRTQGANLKGTKNLSSYVSFRRLPFLAASVTASMNILETHYIKSQIYGLRMYKDLLANLYGGLSYRFINYSFINTNSKVKQHMVELNLNYKISKKFFVSLNHETTLDDGLNLNRLYINLTQRF